MITYWLWHDGSLWSHPACCTYIEKSSYATDHVEKLKWRASNETTLPSDLFESEKSNKRYTTLLTLNSMKFYSNYWKIVTKKSLLIFFNPLFHCAFSKTSNRFSSTCELLLNLCENYLSAKRDCPRKRAKKEVLQCKRRRGTSH